MGKELKWNHFTFTFMNFRIKLDIAFVCAFCSSKKNLRLQFPILHSLSRRFFLFFDARLAFSFERKERRRNQKRKLPFFRIIFSFFCYFFFLFLIWRFHFSLFRNKMCTYSKGSKIIIKKTEIRFFHLSNAVFRTSSLRCSSL